MIEETDCERLFAMVKTGGQADEPMRVGDTRSALPRIP